MNEPFKTVLDFMKNNWGWILSFFSIIFGMLSYINTKIKAVKYGVQALLRAQMIADYNLYSEKGFAPIYAKDNFENCWKRYHALGANGVMDDIHKKFMELPTREELK